MNPIIYRVCPPRLVPELMRLARLDKNWVEIHPELTGKGFRTRSKFPTYLSKIWQNGCDAVGNVALSTWMVDGPKLFRPTVDQCRVMEHIEIGLRLSEYEQPYPALMIELPAKMYAPFHNVLCHKYGAFPMLTCSLFSEGFRDDIVTTIAQDESEIETSVIKFDADCVATSDVASRAIRVALNSCLCLMNFGHKREHILKRQVEDDRQLANEDSERGRRARERIKTSVQLVTFAQEVKLHDGPRYERDPNAEPTGREVKPHFRKGHWAMQPHGPRNSLRKRILRKPRMIRADKFIGEKCDTVATYQKVGG